MRARGEISENEFEKAKEIIETERKLKNIDFNNESSIKSTIKVVLVILGFITIIYSLQLTDNKNEIRKNASKYDTQSTPRLMDAASIRKVGRSTFFVAIGEKIDDPLEYESIAKHICRDHNSYNIDACIVAIWDDKTKMGTMLPMTTQQERAQIYAWSLGRSLWSCRRFPEMGHDRCF